MNRPCIITGWQIHADQRVGCRLDYDREGGGLYHMAKVYSVLQVLYDN